MPSSSRNTYGAMILSRILAVRTESPVAIACGKVVLSNPVDRWVGMLYLPNVMLALKGRGELMDDSYMDEEQLGFQVDAWLTFLRAQGLSDDRRRDELARLLDEAMSESGPTTPEQERVLKRFDAWRHTATNRQSPA